ncbi:ABC transporter ATP-binding protein [Pantoea sp. 18069]|uniref:ABC transporter ATP-binding protein n=1 Tax=Pantoea sp. 18069 TaxID=2681415 RepID=UPI00135713C7|nr:ABC transporter ATP-binding protein [Pantoea sp. 18069]
MTTLLELDHVHLAYDTPRGLRTVTSDLCLSLTRGHIGCLLGASGCGKSTVLRAIAGFESVRQGRILLEDRILSSPRHQVAPELRRVGMMFQDYALFPHMNVARNVGFGLRRQDRARREARVAELLEMVGLAKAGDSYPHELSGGQQQRVALARAMAPSPELLLLDEPFSNLDSDTREHLAAEVRDILRSTGHTAIVVTHNQAEAFAIADRIGSLSAGQLQYWDTPSDLRHRMVALAPPHEARNVPQPVSRLRA